MTRKRKTYEPPDWAALAAIAASELQTLGGTASPTKLLEAVRPLIPKSRSHHLEVQALAAAESLGLIQYDRASQFWSIADQSIVSSLPPVDLCWRGYSQLEALRGAA